MPTYTNLGCFGHCDLIDTAVNAPSDDNYILNTTFNGQIVRVATGASSGDPIVFDSTGLNEDWHYLGYISDSAGQILLNSYIQFTLKVQI